jgi:lysophospholipase L1-like esterase
MLIGDSVVNGGSLTDQSDIINAVLQRRLCEDLHRAVVVGNISAGSWGPPNELAYIKKFGLFDADVVVIVLSSHDARDVMTFEPTVGNNNYPDHRPLCALSEAITVYLPRYLHRGAAEPTSAPKTAAENDETAKQICLGAVRQMVDTARRSGAKVIVAEHLTQDELKEGKVEPGHDEFLKLSHELQLSPVQLGDAFEQAIKSGQQPYRDDIHPGVVGSRIIAEALAPAIETALASPATAPALDTPAAAR